MKKWEGPRHLPVEVWMQILCFLPVKSLLVLRSICKLFLFIIDDPYFISFHLHAYPSNLHESLYLVQRFESRCHIIDNIGKIFYEMRESNGSELIAELDPGLRAFDWRILTGSLDGLLLLLCLDGDEVAMLWNPPLRKFLRLQLPSPESYSKATALRLVGLAYDDSDSDYKVVYIPYSYLRVNRLGHEEVDIDRIQPSGVWVYGVKTRFWTRINLKTSGLCTSPAARWRHPWSLFHKGDLLWIEGWYDSSNEYRLRMVGFDLRTHKFWYHSHLPSQPEKHIKMESRLVTLDSGSSLGLCGLDANGLVSLWTLDDDGESWVRRLVIHQYPVPMQSLVDYGTFVRVSKNGELTWKYQTLKRSIVTFTYNIETHHCQKTETTRSDRCLLYDGDHCAYVESLVML